MSAETDVLERLVQRSHSGNAEERQAALKEIVQLPDDTLLLLLANRVPHNRVADRRLVRRMVSALPYALFMLAILIALCKDPSADPRLRWIPFSLIIGMLLLLLGVAGRSLQSTWLPVRLPGEKARSAVPLPCTLLLLLNGRTDRRFLPYLLSEIAAESALFERDRTETDMFPPALPLRTAFGAPMRQTQILTSPYATSQIRHRYRRLLNGMLAQIDPAEEIPLSTEQRHAMLLLLQRPEENVDLTVSLLLRLEHWGDAQSVPVLKRLIREKHWYVGSDRIEAAARECLEQVEIRLRQQKQGDTLLRPMPGTDAIPTRVLLRPAANSSENPPEQLLRPESSPPEGRL